MKDWNVWVAQKPAYGITQHQCPSSTILCYYIHQRRKFSCNICSFQWNKSTLGCGCDVCCCFPVEGDKEQTEIVFFSLGGSKVLIGEMPATPLIPVRTDHTLVPASPAASAGLCLNPHCTQTHAWVSPHCQCDLTPAAYGSKHILIPALAEFCLV